MSHYAIVVDLDRCIGCHGCEIACKNENEVELGSFWSKVVQVGPFGDYPHLQQYFLPVMCQQCADSPCTHVCPTGASYRDPETNVVLVDKEKCTLCGQLTSVGEQPKCVAACCASARFYGDLDDPNSDASKALAAAGTDAVHRLKDVGNAPQTAYILSSKYADWKEEID